MAVSNITIKGITPNLNILGDTQRFIFSDSSGYFGLRNNFVPTQTIPSLVGFDFSNNSFSGFRFVHQTPFGDNLGTFKLKSFINNDLIGTDILTINSNTIDFNQSVTFSVPPLFQDPTQDLHAANKRFVDNHTWLASSITNFDSTVRTYRLNDFLAPTSNITLNSFRLINLANPINAQDGVNKDYADDMQKTVTLTGAISANGSTGSSINSTFNLRLDQITIPTANINLNNNKIINLATPVLATDAATKSFVESSVSSGISGVPTAVTLTGDVTGSGNTGSSITTTLNKRLDQINAPISSVSLNSQKITNLATPVLSTDAATRGFIDGKTWTASQITDFDIQVRLSRLDQMAIPTTSLNVNSQNIINLATPTLATHAVNKSYADTSTIAPLRITNFPNDSTKYLSGDGNWTTPAGGAGSGDSYQTLTSASSVTWNWANGNIAVITLTTNVTLTITSGTATRGTLIVKQDATGGRTLTLTAGIYRQGTTGGRISLTGTANSIDVFQFFKDGNNNVYIWNGASQFVAIASTPTNIFTFLYDGSIKTLTIPMSANNICRIRMMGGGGGQGCYSNGYGSSGAGGFSVYQFSTTNYINYELKLVVGGGGEGGLSYIRGGVGGYPNGGNGISGDTYPGGGGGRSDIRIGTALQSFGQSTMLAIAGGGGGGTAYSGYGGAGGGLTGQQSQNTSSTAGSQSSGGTSAANPPSPFQQAGYLQGAGGIGYLTGQGYDTGGGGDGYYGGGCSGGDGQASSGGSGYINTGFSGYISSYNSILSGTYQGNQTSVPTQALSYPEFSDGTGMGWTGRGNGTGVIGSNGGNGKIIVEFL
jgi:hypothetical protein